MLKGRALRRRKIEAADGGAGAAEVVVARAARMLPRLEMATHCMLTKPKISFILLNYPLSNLNSLKCRPPDQH